jgi:hypothetical protein
MLVQSRRLAVRLAVIGKHLCRVALALLAVEAGALVIEEFLIPTGEDPGELLINIALLAGLLAPLVAGGALILVKVARAPVSRWLVAGLIAGVLAASLPVLFYLAYGNCPNGVC